MTEQEKMWKIEGADFEKIKQLKDAYDEKHTELHDLINQTRKELWDEIRIILPETKDLKNLKIIDDYESAGLYIIKHNTDGCSLNKLKELLENLKP